MKMKSKHTLMAILTATTLLAGCASIPPEAPELSMELGKRISAIEDAHITLLHRFFDQKRNEIDRFIIEEWVPVFAEEFFSDTKISQAWDTIVRENNPEDRLKFIVLLGPKLQNKINTRRLELIKPLDDLERRIEIHIRGDYNQAMAMNNTLTSFLVSASEVAENRNRYLAMVGATDEKIVKIIDETDAIVGDFLSKAKDAKEKVTMAEEFQGKIRKLLEKI